MNFIHSRRPDHSLIQSVGQRICAVLITTPYVCCNLVPSWHWSEIVQWLACFFGTGDVDVTPSLLSECPPPSGKVDDLWSAAPTLRKIFLKKTAITVWNRLVRYRSFPHRRPTHSLSVGRCRWPLCNHCSAHATSWSHVWKLGVARGPIQFCIPIHSNKAESTDPLQSYCHWLIPSRWVNLNLVTYLI